MAVARVGAGAARVAIGNLVPVGPAIVGVGSKTSAATPRVLEGHELRFEGGDLLASCVEFSSGLRELGAEAAVGGGKAGDRGTIGGSGSG